ncbi:MULTISPECIES: HAMP domain-containing sensor histidine kinase [unclassified Pseudomonas]|uniref:sensor histidine kinase n=1 Tax=unclassified Pseudomonas TaxID=196821 RepID=UPI002AC9D413|nr:MULTISPECIES: HAMP domain-containing sensor histidine kinase [unclassified Pseudomonas]MEB0040980.1 HAMP domain-containing sensor histidine kinase [Pseudomonas sp. MH10]MEB0079332.1 HAMP domain-containing sensor histidine kinase [Pseudomonas sp. MH10out]MEB0093575.1 HAMP domain-containing sensor histidine kinase [Pseudomonas sp. CCI4.2]MEB0100944.1 HAMP domain-containing sensor histidine kinase [Pseudomonas sp. CCI3.2]MEB0121772.1 HAMP domain-containing sensor histidine kinase [Pseudomonas 
MRLSQFIVQNVDSIVDEWEKFAKTIQPAASSLSREGLRDHAKAILLASARDMNTAQTQVEQSAKSKGEGPEKSPTLDQAAASHGELRHTVGFDLVQMTSEFRHLRASVIRMWVSSLKSPELTYFHDMIRFNEAIDEALAESTAAYAEQVGRSRDIFLAILGHDLRAPLQAVSMSTELLIRKVGLDDAALSYIARIKGGTRHMGAMVKDLLEFVRSRLGASLPIQRKPMEMASACREAIEEACAGQPECDPTFEVSGDTRGNWDRGRIDQLLQNLIGNALQHGSNSHQLRLTLSADENSVTLMMQNFGEPIAEGAIGTLFDPLVRSTSEELGHPSTSLGLGLFIVKEVVTAHNGSITVTSNRADGTTFTVVLPKH